MNYLQHARVLVLAPRKQMFARAAVLPRWPACVCVRPVSALDSGLRCRCVVIWRRRTLSYRGRAKVVQNETPNPDSRSLHRRVEVRRALVRVMRVRRHDGLLYS